MNSIIFRRLLSQAATKRQIPNRHLSPAVLRLVTLQRINEKEIQGTGHRGQILKIDVISYMKNRSTPKGKQSVKRAQEYQSIECNLKEFKKLGSQNFKAYFQSQINKLDTKWIREASISDHTKSSVIIDIGSLVNENRSGVHFTLGSIQTKLVMDDDKKLSTEDHVTINVSYDVNDHSDEQIAELLYKLKKHVQEPWN